MSDRKPTHPPEVVVAVEGIRKALGRIAIGCCEIQAHTRTNFSEIEPFNDAVASVAEHLKTLSAYLDPKSTPGGG